MADLIVKQSANRGRGVFADALVPGRRSHRSLPGYRLIIGRRGQARRHAALRLLFRLGRENRGAAIALGFGWLYNHSYTPNAAYRKSEADSTISIIAVKPIAPEDEILIKYNFGDTENCGPLWFDVK